MGKSEQRAWRHRLALLVEHLIRCQMQPRRQGEWARTLRAQRLAIQPLIDQAPALKQLMGGQEFAEGVWHDATVLFIKESQLSDLPTACPWGLGRVMGADFFLIKLALAVYTPSYTSLVKKSPLMTKPPYLAS